MNNQLPNNPNIEVLKTKTTGLFTNYIFKAIPLAFDESMSYYETLCGLLNYLKNTIIPTVNNNADAVSELQNLYVQLKDYVDNYFTNLDVQNEINNKLDNMVESGQLQEIISVYLNSKAIYGYNTVNDMIEANNLIDGSHAKTYGYYNLFDGGGANYLISDTPSDDVLTIQLNNGKYAILEIEKPIIKAKKVGIHCDKVNDDTLKLQEVINYCKDKNYILKLNGYAYVTDTIDTKAIKIIGVGKPANASATYTSSRFGDIGWDYLRNTGNGALITFNDYCTDVLKTGSGIISDVANPIIKCKNSDGKFDLENLTICGWLRNENQEGVISTYESDDNNYINGAHKFTNVNIINCGGNGLHLQSLETTVIKNLQCNFNFGYGCLVEGVNGFDSLFEYVDLYDCHFNGNKLGGFYAHNSYRKQVRFIRCQANSSGLYKQLGISLPSTTLELIAGFKIDGKESSSNTARQCLVFDNCYGEETNKFIELLLNGNGNAYISNNITIENNVSYPTEQNAICCLLYLDAYYIEHFNIHNNFFNGTNLFIPTSQNLNVIPLVVDQTYSIKNYKDVNVNSKITVVSKHIYRDGNLITMEIHGTVNDTINAYENLLTNFTLPPENIDFPIYINNEVYQAGLYTNTNCTVNKQMVSGDNVLISLTYHVKPTTIR